MSDKSKLGFNVNPKNYDELNSTDNLITSGSDSGWLGKKLQGDNSNDLDLSKINPLFDKELYEKYRPGVNTNDGSVNQDIWGYKCFNSPVSFRNGIYGDTYSIQSVEDGDKILGISSGISIQTNQKNTTNNISTLDNKHYSYNVYFESEIFGLKENKYIASTYTGNLRVESFRLTVSNYRLFYNSYVNGSSIENISSRTSNGYSYDYCKLYTFNNPKNTKLSIYNGIDIYSQINKNNEYNDEINIASSKCDTSGSRFPYKVSRITVGTDCSADTMLEQEQSVSGNCIRMYSANGNEHGFDYTNDNISSIIITPDYISISAKNNANQSTDNPYIKIDGTDNSITLHADKLNLPDTIETTAKFTVKAGALSKEINSANYIYATDNSILPSNDSVISLGGESYKYSNIYADRLIGIASAAEKLAYVNPINNAETELLTVSNENLILPRGNKTIQLGRADSRFGTIYGDLNGTAVLADHAATAGQATKDQDGNVIKSSYLNILDFGRNDIESYNAIIGNEKEGLLFLKEKYFDYNSAIPPINKSYSSIQCSFIGSTTSYKTNITWSNEDEDNPIIKTCHVAYTLTYDKNKANFYIVPNGAGSKDPAKHVESMNIGAPDAPWDSIYCDKFPTIHNTIGGYLVGSIRLLCIKTPATSIIGCEKLIFPGNTFGKNIGVPTSSTGTGTLTCIVSHAFFNVAGESAMHLEPTDVPMFEGTWKALCGAHIVIGTSITYIPILAIRIK